MAKKDDVKTWNYVSDFNVFNSKLGWICLILGLYFLAKDLNWIPPEFSIWPVILIAIGAGLILNNLYSSGRH